MRWRGRCGPSACPMRSSRTTGRCSRPGSARAPECATCHQNGINIGSPSSWRARSSIRSKTPKGGWTPGSSTTTSGRTSRWGWCLDANERIVTAPTSSELLDQLAADWYVDHQNQQSHPEQPPSRMIAEHHHEAVRNTHGSVSPGESAKGDATDITVTSDDPGRCALRTQLCAALAWLPGHRVARRSHAPAVAPEERNETTARRVVVGLDAVSRAGRYRVHVGGDMEGEARARSCSASCSRAARRRSDDLSRNSRGSVRRRECDQAGQREQCEPRRCPGLDCGSGSI